MEEKAALRDLIKANFTKPPRPKHLKETAERRRIWKSESPTACQERQVRWSHQPFHTEKGLWHWDGSVLKYLLSIPSHALKGIYHQEGRAEAEGGCRAFEGGSRSPHTKIHWPSAPLALPQR